jgi:hypothetical protein
MGSGGGVRISRIMNYYEGIVYRFKTAPIFVLLRKEDEKHSHLILEQQE